MVFFSVVCKSKSTKVQFFNAEDSCNESDRLSKALVNCVTMKVHMTQNTPVVKCQVSACVKHKTL